MDGATVAGTTELTQALAARAAAKLASERRCSKLLATRKPDTVKNIFTAAAPSVT